MKRRKVTLKFLCLLVCVLVLTGCDRSAKERDKAIAEAEQAKAELARVETALEEAQNERDELKKTITKVSEELEKTRSGATTILKLYEALKIQSVELTNERDAAVAEAKDAKETVKKLSDQLKEKAEEILEFGEWVKELQATIKYLKGQVEKIDNQSSEQSVEDIIEQVNEIHEPDVVFVPTPQDVVDKMLELAEVKKGDLVYDLGCGDGRIVVTAAKRYGCKAIGYDIDPQRVEESLENVERNNVGRLVKIEQKDIFTLDLSKANVIMLYLLPELNVKLIPQLEKLKPGSRIVSHDFDMEGVRPDKVVTLTSDEDGDERKIYLWTSPLKKIPD
ncbi:MAG: methyltransferase domain-containing protein [Planctomycetota bacterium]|jgi:ribosomal protein L11 methylase PrmA